MYWYEDAAGNRFLRDSHGDFYRTVDADTGYYIFQGVDPASGDIERFYGTDPAPDQGTIYRSDKTTVVAHPESLGLVRGFDLVQNPDALGLTPVLQSTYAGNIVIDGPFTAQASQRIAIEAQHGASGLASANLNLVGDTGAGQLSLTTGDDLTVDGLWQADGLVSLVSTGYGQIDVDGAISLSGGNIHVAAGTRVIGTAGPTATIEVNALGDATVCADLTAGALLRLAAGGGLGTDGARLHAPQIDAAAGSGMSLAIDAAVLSARLNQAGDMVIDALQEVDLQNVVTADGLIRVEADGTIRALDVRSLSDRAEAKIELISRKGDVEAGYVEAGRTAGHVRLDAAAGRVREIASTDPDADVVG